MSKIISKLNLNKTPQLVENNSLIMAKNIKLLKDGTIGPDTSLEEIETAAVIDHTETITIEDRPPIIAVTDVYKLSIHIANKYCAIKPDEGYVEVDGVMYYDWVYDPTDTRISIPEACYYTLGDTFISPDCFFDVTSSAVVSRDYPNCNLIYLIHIQAYSGNDDFDTLLGNGITPYYYGIGKLTTVGTTVEINGETYVVVNPVEINVETTTQTSPGQYHTETITYYTPVRYIGQIVGLDNKVYFFKEATEEEFTEAGLSYPTDDNDKIRIFEYDEVLKTFTIVKCAWRYSGGFIDGVVTTNSTKEIIITICEYFETDSDVRVPIKHINLFKCSETDDETTYTQAPNIPFTNLYFTDYYQCTIPNGVYQFFVRYKIRNDFYTEWFPCSEELYAGFPITTDTVQGTLRYVDHHRDCPRSFKFSVEHLFDGVDATEDYTKNFSEFQIGFILSHDDAVVARSWKSFPFDNENKVTEIYFDYDKNIIEEIDVDELLKTNFELFNVRNLAYYKNKLFIANYEETDFNPELQRYANAVRVALNGKTITFNDDDVSILGKNLTKTDNNLTYFDKWGGITIDKLFNVSEILNDNVINDNVVDKDYYNNTTTKFVLKAEMYWKNSNDIDATHNYYEYDVYWLRKLELGLSFYDNGSQYAKFVEYDSTLYDNPGDAGLLGSQSTTRHWYDAKNHAGGNDIPELTYRWYWRGGSINANQQPGNGWPDFKVYPYGLRGQHSAEAQWKNTFINAVRQRYPSLVLANLSINYNGGSKTIKGGSTYFDNDNEQIHGVPIAYNQTYTDSQLKNLVFSYVKQNILGLRVSAGTSNGKFVILDDNDQIREVTNITAVFITLDYSVDCQSIESNSEINNALYVNAICKQRTITYNCDVKNIELNNANNKYEYKTLMPFTEYEFYIHYIKQNGVNTNGYYIDTKRYNDYTNLQHSLQIIYPSFTNISIPTGYVGYFITINKIKNDVARLFNIRRYDTNKDPNYIYADCLECDTMLYPLSKNIKIYKKLPFNNGFSLTPISTNGEYFSSGSNNPISEFGNCGEVRWPAADDIEPDNIQYESISSTVFVPKNMTTGSIFLRAGIDDNDRSNVVANINLASCLSNGEIDKTLLKQAIKVEIASYSCLAVEVTEKYESIWNISSEHSEIPNRGEGDAVPATELKGYNVTLYSKSTTTNDITINNVIYLGLLLVDNTLSSSLDVITTRINQYYVSNSVNVLSDAIVLDKYLKDIAAGSAKDDVITKDIAVKIIGFVIYAKLLENNYWIVIDNNNENNKNKRLTKITPFIRTAGSYDNYELNLPGFINVVGKLQHTPADRYYISGSDFYIKKIGNDNLELDDIEGSVGNAASERFYIPSNFNLNCVVLNEDITPNIRTYLPDLNDEDTTEKQVVKAVNSLTCSSILTLPTMYYDYIRKYFSVYDKEQKYKFDNTIRSSDANTDETYRNIYKFRAEDYYNIPVNRGIITNLFNLVNYIYVHTEHSLFRFSGNNNLSSVEGDIAIKEGDVFDNGIVELFDAQHGYAGLKHKKQSLVMFDSYVFWDDYVQQIYAFGGEGKIAPISDPIDKVIKEFKPDDIQFVGDEVNDRFFINFRKNDANICLSFNFKFNSITSIHDIDFSFGFNTRLHTYLIHTDVSNDKEIGWSIYHIIDKLIVNNNKYFVAYQNCWTPSAIVVEDLRHALSNKSLYGVAEACVDIITNVSYERIKSLNYINWICSEILQYGFESNFVAEEDLNRKYSGNKLRVYSDECSTDLISLVDSNGNALDSASASSLSDPNSYMYPRYNCGVWSLNYFRNIRNKNDIFNYTAAKNQITGGIGHSQTTDLREFTQRRTYTQENSLIYGKYIVLRLIFDNRNFKLENVTFNLNDYEKVK